MRGFRTRPITYRRGVSGKQTAYLRAELDGRPRLLLLSDSNSRNLVLPRVVVPSVSCPFSFSVICLPGGTMRHGVAELRNTTPFPSVDYLVIALGTNDVASYQESEKNFSSYFHGRAIEIIDECKRVYPGSKILLAKILPQTGRHTRVQVANVVLSGIASDAMLPLLDLDVGKDPNCWNGRLHLSDVGLQQYMETLESSVSNLVGVSNNKEKLISFGSFVTDRGESDGNGCTTSQRASGRKRRQEKSKLTEQVTVFSNNDDLSFSRFSMEYVISSSESYNASRVVLSRRERRSYAPKRRKGKGNHNSLFSRTKEEQKNVAVSECKPTEEQVNRTSAKPVFVPTERSPPSKKMRRKKEKKAEKKSAVELVIRPSGKVTNCGVSRVSSIAASDRSGSLDVHENIEKKTEDKEEKARRKEQESYEEMSSVNVKVICNRQNSHVRILNSGIRQPVATEEQRAAIDVFTKLDIPTLPISLKKRGRVNHLTCRRTNRIEGEVKSSTPVRLLGGGGTYKKNVYTAENFAVLMNSMEKFDPHDYDCWYRLVSTFFTPNMSKYETKRKILEQNHEQVSHASSCPNYKQSSPQRDDVTFDLEMTKSNANDEQKQENAPEHPDSSQVKERHVESTTQAWIPIEDLPNKAEFIVKEDDWNAILCSVKNRIILYKDWGDKIRDGMKLSNPYCSFAFRRHTFNTNNDSGRVCFTLLDIVVFLIVIGSLR
uniref:uncharacterized protein LOC120347882 n=1 Tax=Styela clava TaxID=7725 RepID=UPI00193AA410|nr:uncharacterized protein LOC120347882 [Styela clava]